MEICPSVLKKNDFSLKNSIFKDFIFLPKLFHLKLGIPCTLFKKSISFSKNSILRNPNIFTSFSPKFFWTIFLVKSKLSTAKKPKTTTFSRVFHPKKSAMFSGNQS